MPQKTKHIDESETVAPTQPVEPETDKEQPEKPAAPKVKTPGTSK